MKLLCFQAKRFWWKSFSPTLPEVAPRDEEGELCETVVVFLQAEQADEGEGRASVMRQTLKHIKWLANKRALKNVVLHSFAHLGGSTGDPKFAESFLNDAAERLRAGGYQVRLTPFGHFCEWDLSVYGDSLAKVWKEIP